MFAVTGLPGFPCARSGRFAGRRLENHGSEKFSDTSSVVSFGRSQAAEAPLATGPNICTVQVLQLLTGVEIFQCFGAPNLLNELWAQSISAFLL
jgi:hypothetical protein